MKRPGFLCLTTCIFVHRDANVSPLILFCHLMVTPTSAPLRTRHSTVVQNQGISANSSPLDIFNTCPSSYLCAIVCCTNPFSALFVPCWKILLGTHGGWQEPFNSFSLKTFCYCLRSYFCVKMTPGNNPEGVDINGIQINWIKCYNHNRHNNCYNFGYVLIRSLISYFPVFMLTSE